MMPQIESHVPSITSSVSMQVGSVQKRPRSFYSSSIKTWASRLSEPSGNSNGSGTKTKVGTGDIRDSLKQTEGDGGHNVNQFSEVIDCETLSDKSSTGARSYATISTEDVTACDVVISDSDDDLGDSQEVQFGSQKVQGPRRVGRPQKAKRTNSKSHSVSAKLRSKVHEKKAFPQRKTVTPKLSSRKTLDVGLFLEVDSDDDDDEESFVNVTPSLKNVNNNVDVRSCQLFANNSSLRRPPVIEIESDSCSSIADGASSQTIALQNHSVSCNVEKTQTTVIKITHSNNPTILPFPTPHPSQQSPNTEVGAISFPSIPGPAAPVWQYSNFQGAFQSYCGNDKATASAAPCPSNGGAQLSISSDGHANGVMSTDKLDQEQILAFLKSGKFSLQFIAGVPVLCPINVPPVNCAVPFNGSELANMKAIVSFNGPSLKTNTVAYGTVRSTVPGSVSTTMLTNAVGCGTRWRLQALMMDRRSMSGAQSSSSFGVRNCRPIVQNANISKTFINKAACDVGSRNKVRIKRGRKRAGSSTCSPNKRARGKAMTPRVLSMDEDKNLGDKAKRDEDRTDKDNKNKPRNYTTDKTKKDGERPMAKALIGLAMQLVAKQVIVKLIKVTKKTLDKKPEEKVILMKLQNRHAELMCEAEAFELRTNECRCGRFKTESSNVLIEHLQHGASTRVYRCCICSSTMKLYQTFRQHMIRRHKISGSQKHDQRKVYSCAICPFDSSHLPTFEFHSRRCLSLLQTEKNLHPRLDDFDIPIFYEEGKRQQVAKELSLVANTGSKINPYGQLLNTSMGVLCLTCGKSCSSRHALWRHRRSAHNIPDLKSGGTPLKQLTPSEIPGNRTPAGKSASTHTPLTTPSKIPINATSNRNVSIVTPLKQTTPSMISGNRTLGKDTSADVSSQPAAATVKCCLCDESLGREMVQHFQVQHHITLNTMAKKHFCYFCDRSLPNYVCFEEHMVSTHRTVFPDMKTLWNKILASVRFRERDAFLTYNASENNDTVVQPWQCLVCKMRFVSSSFCYRHALLFHTTAKVECQLCPKMIATGATYTEHLQQCHIRKCYVVIERRLPFNWDSKMDGKLPSSNIKSPLNVTSCDQDFSMLDK